MKNSSLDRVLKKVDSCNNEYKDLNKVLKVIDHCKTESQFESAEKMIVLLINKYKEVSVNYKQLYDYLKEQKNLKLQKTL
jgi:hypothetical protein